MIAMIDHISYIIDNRRFNNLILPENYILKFSEIDIQNDEVKKKYMKNYQEYHSMYFYDCDGDVSIEVICYDKIWGESSFKRKSTNCFSYETHNVEKSFQFWSDLNFRVLEHEECKNELVFKNIFGKQNFHLQLVEKDQCFSLTLDTEGYSCITLISNNISKEYFRLNEKGYGCSSIGEMVINEKKVNLFFVEGPCGELVEIISF